MIFYLNYTYGFSPLYSPLKPFNLPHQSSFPPVEPPHHPLVEQQAFPVQALSPQLGPHLPFLEKWFPAQLDGFFNS